MQLIDAMLRKIDRQALRAERKAYMASGGNVNVGSKNEPASISAETLKKAICQSRSSVSDDIVGENVLFHQKYGGGGTDAVGEGEQYEDTDRLEEDLQKTQKAKEDADNLIKDLFDELKGAKEETDRLKEDLQKVQKAKEDAVNRIKGLSDKLKDSEDNLSRERQDAADSLKRNEISNQRIKELEKHLKTAQLSLVRQRQEHEKLLKEKNGIIAATKDALLVQNAISDANKCSPWATQHIMDVDIEVNDKSVVPGTSPGFSTANSNTQEPRQHLHAINEDDGSDNIPHSEHGSISTGSRMNAVGSLSNDLSDDNRQAKKRRRGDGDRELPADVHAIDEHEQSNDDCLSSGCGDISDTYVNSDAGEITIESSGGGTNGNIQRIEPLPRMKRAKAKSGRCQDDNDFPPPPPLPGGVAEIATDAINATGHEAHIIRRKKRAKATAERDLPTGVQKTSSGKFQARIKCGKTRRIGLFDAPEQASAAFLSVRKDLRDANLSAVGADEVEALFDAAQKKAVEAVGGNLPKKRSKRDLPKGVSKLPSGKFQSRIMRGGKKRHIGTFDNPEQASAAYVREGGS